MIATNMNTNTAELSSRVVSFNVNNFMSSGASASASQSNLSYDENTQEDSLTLNSASATNLDADVDVDADDINTITTGNSADFGGGGSSTIEAFQASSRLWREEYEARLD